MVLVGDWPLNESSGSTAYDHSGNDNHGTVNGAGPVDTGTVSGPLGQSAYGFDRSDDNVNVGKSVLASNGGGTWSVWIKTSADASSSADEVISETDANGADPVVSIYLADGK